MERVYKNIREASKNYGKNGCYLTRIQRSEMRTHNMKDGLIDFLQEMSFVNALDEVEEQRKILYNLSMS